MSEPLVRIHVHERVGTIVLNRPAQRNAISRALLSDLQQAFYDLHLEKPVRAVVLVGSGAAFCAGMDLKEMLETSKSEQAWQQWHEDAVAYKELIETMLRFPKPIIAAVNGPAVAGGLGLVLASDLVLAAQNASFALPEPRRGIVAGMVAPLLSFRIGAGRAAWLLLTGESCDAQTGREYGIVHQITPADQLWPSAQILAGVCAQNAPEALQLTKRLLNETIGEQLFVQLSSGAAASATARTTEAAAEGLAAFVEKRQPSWP